MDHQNKKYGKRPNVSSSRPRDEERKFKDDKDKFKPRKRPVTSSSRPRDEERKFKDDKDKFKPRKRPTSDSRPANRDIKGGDKDEKRPYPIKRDRRERVDIDEHAATAKKDAKMPLNKFVSHCGICSRRDAAILIKEGKVTINNELVIDPGHKVQDNDTIMLDGKKITPQKGLVYILLNKPKDYITTTDDEKGRKTVMELVSGAGEGRFFPVGRLDRNTTGLLLITNDGELSQRLSHPSYKIKKIYHVTLNKPLTQAHFDKVLSGLELEDGMVHVDSLAYLEKKNELGIEIHSGKNRVVRRIFESLEYEVEKLDRMMYAGLTKKNLPRGRWRMLTPHEVVLLKHFKS